MRQKSPGRNAGLQPAGFGTDPMPLYYKLESVLRTAIEAGQYSLGSALPSERQLGELYGVSRITVRRALETLQRDGLIWRGRGRRGGSFVKEPPRGKEMRLFGSFDALFSTRQITRIDVLAFDVRSCPADVAAKLGVSASAEVRYIERVLSTKTGPIAHVRNFLPFEYGGKLRESEIKTRMLHQVLRRRGVAIAEIQDEVGALVADSQTALMLSIRAGAAVLSVRRTFSGPSGRAVNLTAMLLRTDTYRLSIRIRSEGLD